jgi:hypothetical protein
VSRAIFRTGNYTLPVRAEQGDANRAPVTQHLKRFAGGYVPDPGGLIFRSGDEACAIGIEAGAGDTRVMLERDRPRLPGL